MLAGLPAALGEFLVTTSFLDRLTAPLCDAVTGGVDGAALPGRAFLAEEDGSLYRVSVVTFPSDIADIAGDHSAPIELA